MNKNNNIYYSTGYYITEEPPDVPYRIETMLDNNSSSWHNNLLMARENAIVSSVEKELDDRFYMPIVIKEFGNREYNYSYYSRIKDSWSNFVDVYAIMSVLRRAHINFKKGTTGILPLLVYKGAELAYKEAKKRGLDKKAKKFIKKELKKKAGIGYLTSNDTRNTFSWIIKMMEDDLNAKVDIGSNPLNIWVTADISDNDFIAYIRKNFLPRRKSGTEIRTKGADKKSDLTVMTAPFSIAFKLIRA